MTAAETITQALMDVPDELKAEVEELGMHFSVGFDGNVLTPVEGRDAAAYIESRCDTAAGEPITVADILEADQVKSFVEGAIKRTRTWLESPVTLFGAADAIKAILDAPEQVKEQLEELDVQITVGFDGARMKLSESTLRHLEHRGGNGVYLYARRKGDDGEFYEFGDAVNSVERTHKILDAAVLAFKRSLQTA